MKWPALPPDVMDTLPPRVTCESDWQTALCLVLPRVLPLRLHRQIPGKKKVEHGGWMQGAPAGAADLSGWARGGLRLEIEAKYGSGKLRPEQLLWRKVCADWQVLHVVAHYDPADDLRTNLEAIARRVRKLLLDRGVEVPT